MNEFSDEAEECQECAEVGFTIVAGVIRKPGKFEGEPLATYHAYHVAMDGFWDDRTDDYDRVGNVILFYRSDGFVEGAIFADEAEAIEVWDTDIEPADYGNYNDGWDLT